MWALWPIRDKGSLDEISPKTFCISDINSSLDVLCIVCLLAVYREPIENL